MYSQLQERGESKCTVLRGTSIEQDTTKTGTDQKGISQKLENMMLIVDASTKYISSNTFMFAHCLITSNTYLPLSIV